MQHGLEILYGSCQLKWHKVNFPMHNLELAIVVCAIKLYKHYLYGETFDVFMNHKEPEVYVLAIEAKHEELIVDGVPQGL